MRRSTGLTGLAALIAAAFGAVVLVGSSGASAAGPCIGAGDGERSQASIVCESHNDREIAELCVSIRGLSGLPTEVTRCESGRDDHVIVWIGHDRVGAVVPGRGRPLGFKAETRANVCISINGVELQQSGTATCESEDGGNIAVAVGDGSLASALGSDNTAVAIGDGSNASAVFGGGHTAIAIGDSTATAGNGRENTALAIGQGSHAAAANGDDNRARVIGENSVAFAVGGDDGIAIVFGDGSTASSNGGCTVIIIGDGIVDSCP